MLLSATLKEISSKLEQHRFHYPEGDLCKSPLALKMPFLPGLEGRMDISRWRQPPVIHRRNHPPR